MLGNSRDGALLLEGRLKGWGRCEGAIPCGGWARVWGPAGGRNGWEAAFLRGPLPVHPFCLPSPLHPLGPKPRSFLSCCSVLCPLFPSFQGWGEGLVRAPGAESYLDPQSLAPSAGAGAAAPLPSTSPALAVPSSSRGGGGGGLAHVTPSLPSMPHRQPLPQLRV